MILAALRITEIQGIQVVSVTGEIDMSNVGEVRNDLLSRISNATQGVVVDLGQVTYLDSKGIHLLVQLHERLQRGSQNMRIVCSPDSLLHQLLLVSRLPIPMDETVEAAVARAQTPTAI